MAARTGDRPGFDAQVTPDPSFAGRADLWFSNLRQLGRDRVELAGSSDGIALGADRWTQRVVVSWRPAGSREVAEQSVWLTFAGDRALLAGDTDIPGADSSAPRPIWLSESVAVQRRGAVTVVSAGPAEARWLDRGERAVTAVRSALRRIGGSSWSGPLVLELPADRAMFERSLGVAAGSYAGIGAVAWPRGDERATAAVHVVVNPEVAGRLAEDGLAVLLAHEGTHVATRSVDSAAPSWLTEGLADYVAYERYPATQSAARQPLRDQLRRGKLPDALPPDAAFAADAAELDRAYAQSWSLCQHLSRRYGPTRFGRFYRSVHRGTSVPEALHTAFGIGPDTLINRWRTDVRRWAGRP